MTMNRNQIETTQWAKAFKMEAPTSYDEAITIASNPDMRFELNQTDEAGEKQWVISPVESRFSGFWMDAKKTKKAAIELCREMGWKVVC